MGGIFGSVRGLFVIIGTGFFWIVKGIFFLLVGKKSKNYDVSEIKDSNKSLIGAFFFVGITAFLLFLLFRPIVDHAKPNQYFGYIGLSLSAGIMGSFLAAMLNSLHDWLDKKQP